MSVSFPKFKIGEKITIKSGTDFPSDNKQVKPAGHVVIIMEPHSEDPVYYCSMYPGAYTGYEYVYVFDLEAGGLEEDGTPITYNALNKFRQSEIQAFNG